MPRKISFQKRHFEFIAAVIRNMDMLDYSSKAFVTYRFANSLGITNPAFKRDKFLHACGIDKLL